MLPRTAKSAFAAVNRRSRASQSKQVASNVSATNFASGFTAKVQQKFEILKNVPAANFLSGLSVEQRAVSESQIKSDNKQSKTGTAITAYVAFERRKVVSFILPPSALHFGAGKISNGCFIWIHSLISLAGVDLMAWWLIALLGGASTRTSKFADFYPPTTKKWNLMQIYDVFVTDDGV
jgi:hypothetical protein